MIDEIWDRQYRSGRASLNDGIDRFAKRIGQGMAATFAAIHDVQFARPWSNGRWPSKAKRTGCA